jgi:sugar O-acyltransferase (sialic acid O-acetyltransferase NeuD family)
VRTLLVVGAGGHGRVVADAAVESGVWERVVFLDDRFPALDSSDGWPVVGVATLDQRWIRDYPAIAVAIGENTVRLDCARRFLALGYALPTVVHPSACIGRSAVIGDGTVLLAQSAVNSGARLGVGCIINTAAVVEHDCELGDGVHVSPAAALAGAVRVGECAWIGIGASVNQEIRIGAAAVIAAGAAVVRDVGAGRTAVGIPARLLGRAE